MGVSWVIVVLVLVNTAHSIVDNRKPEANYVIPIAEDKSAIVYCVSHFAKPIIQLLGPGEEKALLECDPCEEKKIRYRCCKAVSWEEVASPMRLRCTSRGPGWPKEDKNTPQIEVSVVRKVSKVRPPHTFIENSGLRIIANSSTVYFCHTPSDASMVIAGSHIGLGWLSYAGKYTVTPTPKPMQSSHTEKLEAYDQLIEGLIDDGKADELENMYHNSEFEKLWISEDLKVELMEHKTKFSCNETDYYLPKGSRCMTPSSNAIFVMTNCSLIEQIFIVIGVIALLVISYIVFNVLVWIWNFCWNKSHKYDDGKDDLTVLKSASEIQT